MKRPTYPSPFLIYERDGIYSQPLSPPALQPQIDNQSDSLELLSAHAFQIVTERARCRLRETPAEIVAEAAYVGQSCFLRALAAVHRQTVWSCNRRLRCLNLRAAPVYRPGRLGK